MQNSNPFITGRKNWIQQILGNSIDRHQRNSCTYSSNFVYSDCTQNDCPKPFGQEKKNKVVCQGIHNENTNCHCIVRSRHHHQCLVDKTLAGSNFNVYRVRNSARGLGMVPCLDLFCTKKIIIRQNHSHVHSSGSSRGNETGSWAAMANSETWSVICFSFLGTVPPALTV